MRSRTRRLGTFLLQLGVDPRRMFAALRFLPGYLVGARQLRAMLTPEDRQQFKFRWLPILSDRYTTSGVAQGHYFHQDLWAARKIHAAQPERHVDVGSRVDGFVAHLLTFRTVEVLDVRPLQSKVAGLHFRQADLMHPVGDDIGTADSVSCLHALEHFGLGRYGDPISPAGWRAGLANLAGLVRRGGRLYLSVPVGRAAIEFNAQRIFSPSVIIDAAGPLGLRLIDFAYIDDQGEMHEHSEPASASDCDFACGCFCFEKLL